MLANPRFTYNHTLKLGLCGDMCSEDLLELKKGFYDGLSEKCPSYSGI